MKIFITLSCLVVVSLATPTIFDLHSQWAQFKITHKKTYETIEKEQKRFEIFIDNFKKIEEHNKLYEQGLVTYKLGINQFSDLTHEEFASSLGGRRTQPIKIKPVNGTFVKQLNTQNLPDAFDWRNKSAVTPVGNQKGCPASWAFAVIGAIEGQFARKYGKLMSLSKQELVDCVDIWDAKVGCREVPSTDDIYDYILSNGLTSDNKWPYIGYAQDCNNYISRSIYISSYQTIEHARLDEDILAHAVVKFGPITVRVCGSTWQYYAEGIFTGDCGDCIDGQDYALIVGYGSENDQDYWIVKNSWGKYWGENGYIRLPRYQNKCYIADEPTYPVLV